MYHYRKKVQLHFNELSAGMKKVARHLLDSPQSFAIQSAGQVGKEIGVSETTVIRFCYALEYSGYSELKKEVREELITTKSSLQEFQSDKEELANHSLFYSNVFKKHQLHIQKTMDQLSENDLQNAVNRLITTDQILVGGMRTSFAVAHWLVFTLNLIRGNAKLYQPGTDDLLLLLSKMNTQSTFVAISFHRYATETIMLAEALKKKGVFIIGITDSEVAPISMYSDILLPVSLPVKSTIDAAPSVFTLLNALLFGITINDPERFKQRKVSYEAAQLDHFFYRKEKD